MINCLPQKDSQSFLKWKEARPSEYDVSRLCYTSQNIEPLKECVDVHTLKTIDIQYYDMSKVQTTSLLTPTNITRTSKLSL